MGHHFNSYLGCGVFLLIFSSHRLLTFTLLYFNVARFVGLNLVFETHIYDLMIYEI